MVKEIPLTQGQVALVDDADYDALSRFKWYANRTPRKNHPDQFFAARKVKSGPGTLKRIAMHRALVACPDHLDVDHKDGNPLNNQRENLRLTNDSGNQANRSVRIPNPSSRFRGVTWHRSLGRWQAQIKVNQKSHYLGTFDLEEEAAVSYDIAATHHFGEFARLNFPERSVA